MTSTSKSINTQAAFMLLYIFVVITMHAIPAAPAATTGTAYIPSEQTSTDIPDLDEKLTSDGLIQRQVASVYHNGTEPASTTAELKTNNTIKAPRGRAVTVAGSAYSSSNSTTESSTLSGGAIAGIVIGVIVLLCCLALCGCCKSGHWENRKVWVEH